MSLCQYKDLFGKPNEGIRRYRIANIAIFDTAIVIIICLIIEIEHYIENAPSHEARLRPQVTNCDCGLKSRIVTEGPQVTKCD